MHAITEDFDEHHGGEIGFVTPGINGCSLKTDSSLATVARLPVDRLMLETDAPWCGIRPSHASSRFVRTLHSRQERDKKKFVPGCLVKGVQIRSCVQATLCASKMLSKSMCLILSDIALISDIADFSNLNCSIASYSTLISRELIHNLICIGDHGLHL